MKVKNFTRNSELGKVFVLEAEIEGRTVTAQYVWPPEFDHLHKGDAADLIEHQLWRMLMGYLEQELRKALYERT